MVPVLVPPLWANPTVSPPDVRFMPPASLARNVSVTALPEATVPADTVTVDRVVETEPGTLPDMTAIVGEVDVTLTPLMVAPMAAGVPDAVAVNVATYVPLPRSELGLIVPVLVPPEAVNTTLRPPVIRLLPL